MFVVGDKNVLLHGEKAMQQLWIYKCYVSLGVRMLEYSSKQQCHQKG